MSDGPKARRTGDIQPAALPMEAGRAGYPCGYPIVEPPFAPLKLINFAPIAAAFGFPPIFLFRENRAAAVRAGWLLPGLGRMVTHNLCASPGGARLMVKQEQGRRFLALDGG